MHMGCCDCRLSFSEILKILKFRLPHCALGTLFPAILPSLPAALYAEFAVWKVWARRWEEGWQGRWGGQPWGGRARAETLEHSPLLRGQQDLSSFFSKKKIRFKDAKLDMSCRD